MNNSQFAGYAQTTPSFIPDVLTQLRKAATSNPIAATTSESSKEIAIAHHLTAFRLEIGSAAYSGYVANTSYWKVVLEASADATTGFKAIGECVLTPKNAQAFSIKSEIITNGVIAENLVPGSKYLRCTAVKVGNPGSLNYNAHMTPIGPFGA
jgi:hypothetical protein